MLECSSAIDRRSDFFTFFLQRMSDCGVDLYGDGDIVSDLRVQIYRGGASQT